MAAPAFGAAGTQLQGSGSTMSVDVPAGVLAGHIIVVTAFIDGTSVTVTAMPTGFAQATGSPQLALNHRLYVMWKRATGADSNGSTYDFTLSGSSYRNAQAIRYTGAVASGDPWDVVDAAANADSGSQDGVTPAVNVTTDVVDTLLVFAGSNWAGGTWTPPTGFTERRDTGDGVVTVADQAQTSAGASGSVSATATGSSNGRAAWLGALMSVAPAGGDTIAPDGITVPVTLGSPTAAAQTTAAPDGISVPVALGSPTLAWSATVAPDGITTPVTLGAPTVGAATVSPDGVSIPVTLGGPTLAWSATVSPDGLALPVMLGSPAVGAAPVAPAGIAVPVALGAPALAWSAAITPDGLSIPVTLGGPAASIPGAVVHRPNTGTIVRPDTGTISRPNTGTVSRP